MIFFSVIIILCFYINTQNSNTNPDAIVTNIEDSSYYFSNSNFFWPLPGFHRITSPFGRRVSPTSGASTYHSGIDIAAPEGTNIFSVTTGKVIFIGFKGAGGFTITVESNNYNISYCHVSPKFIVTIGSVVSSGSIIGNVGPKYVDNVPNNKYKDSSGRGTNGATTGCHLHLTIKKDGKAVNPLSFF